MSLLLKIERHLRETGTPPSRFGREVMCDPGFVAWLRRGREPRRSTINRVEAYLSAAQASAEPRR